VKPYYQHSGVTIYHGDCREVLPMVGEVDAVISDPPYPDYHAEAYRYDPDALLGLDALTCRQLICWSAKAPFPLSFTAIHIWDKKTGCGSEYERIYERNGQANWTVFRHYLMNSTVAASFTGDVFTGHPSQKPEALLRELVVLVSKVGDVVLDPFMGSGTTLVAAKRRGRHAIGIEIEERYCEIAANRLRQEALPLEVA
jgi:site-specific DNA-methyltransferase (adenine-specific)